MERPFVLLEDLLIKLQSFWLTGCKDQPLALQSLKYL
jgi:hypothetical protein